MNFELLYYLFSHNPLMNLINHSALGTYLFIYVFIYIKHIFIYISPNLYLPWMMTYCIIIYCYLSHFIHYLVLGIFFFLLCNTALVHSYEFYFCMAFWASLYKLHCVWYIKSSAMYYITIFMVDLVLICQYSILLTQHYHIYIYIDVVNIYSFLSSPNMNSLIMSLNKHSHLTVIITAVHYVYNK